MSDQDRLSRSLARLRTRRETSRILRPGPRPLLGALLAVADDIILERHVTLAPDNGAAFGLIVSNRRVVGVTSSTEPDLTARANAALRDGIATDDGQSMDAIRNWFEAHLRDIGETRISIANVAEELLHQAVGISADQLARALSVDLTDPADTAETPQDADLIGRFHAAAQVLATAWVRLSGGAVAERSGVAADDLASRSLGAGSDAPRLVLRAGADGGITANAWASGHEVILAGPAGNLTDLAAAWHRALHP